MSRRIKYGFGLVVLATLVLATVPAMAAQRGPRTPDVTVTWTYGPNSPFAGTRFDGEYVASLNRVYFLGFRTTADATDGSVWYFDIATQTYVDTGVDMKAPVSNYQISALTDSAGNLGLYIFGGRDANAQIVTTVQVYYPAINQSKVIATDPWPGTTPSACISLPAMGVATIKNHAIVLGGMSFTANGCIDDNSAETWIFNPKGAAGARWTPGPALTQARGYITPAVLGGKIYAIGGDVNGAGVLTAVRKVEAWQPPAGTWNDAGVADLPNVGGFGCDESQAFPFTAGPAAGDIVLAYCGQWPNAVQNTLLYDTAANTWSQAGLVNDVRRNAAGALIPIGGKQTAYILGGYGGPSFIDPIVTSELGKTGAFGYDVALRPAVAHARANRVPTS
jgi:hypothetical protein